MKWLGKIVLKTLVRTIEVNMAGGSENPYTAGFIEDDALLFQ